MLGFDTTRNCRQIKHKGLCGVFFLYTTNISTGLSFSSHDFNLLFGGNKYISQEKHTISHVTKAVLYHERSTMPCAWFVFSVCLIFLSFMLFPYCYLLSEFFFSSFSVLSFLIHPFFFFASGILFLLWGAVSSVSAPWLHLLLWHFLIYRSREWQATGRWHWVAMTTQIQHMLTLIDRFVTGCPSPCHCSQNMPA